MQKILTLVNGVPRLVEEIFGAYYQDVESLVSQTNTTTTFNTLLTINTPIVTAGRYAIAYDALYSFSVTNRDALYRMQVDGVTVYDSTERVVNSAADQKISAEGFKKINLTAATHTITLQFAVSGGTPTFNVKECRLEFFRVE